MYTIELNSYCILLLIFYMLVIPHILSVGFLFLPSTRTRSPPPLLAHSLAHSLTNSLTRSLTHSITHSLTHSHGTPAQAKVSGQGRWSRFDMQSVVPW